MGHTIVNNMQHALCAIFIIVIMLAAAFIPQKNMVSLNWFILFRFPRVYFGKSVHLMKRVDGLNIDSRLIGGDEEIDKNLDEAVLVL